MYRHRSLMLRLPYVWQRLSRVDPSNMLRRSDGFPSTTVPENHARFYEYNRFPYAVTFAAARTDETTAEDTSKNE